MAEETHYCYMGHADCWDEHTQERLADEADWEQDRQREMEEEADRFLGLYDTPRPHRS